MSRTADVIAASQPGYDACTQILVHRSGKGRDPMQTLARYAAALIVVCGVACTSSPSSPSSTAASIGGAVRAVSGGSATSSLAGMRVAVSGTSLATTTSVAGQFNLNDVPPGNVTLLFDRAGLNALLPLGTVHAGDKVTIVVTINGSNASLDSRHDERDDEDDEDEDEVEGRISSLAESCPNRTFNVGNTAVRTSSSTKYEHVTCDTLANNMKIEVEGTFANGVLNATKIEKD
jgi:hypothetical protein